MSEVDVSAHKGDTYEQTMVNSYAWLTTHLVGSGGTPRQKTAMVVAQSRCDVQGIRLIQRIVS